MHSHMRTKLSAALVAALALSALLLAGGASAQRAPRQGNDNASGGQPKSKRVFVGRGSETGQGSRVTITADDSLKDYSAYRSGDRFYVVLPKSAAGARGGGGSGRGYSDMQVQQRGDSVVLSYRVQPGAKPRVEQRFNRLDVVFDVPGDAGQQAATNNAARQQPTPPAENRTPAAQQNNQTQAATRAPDANPTPERRQPTAEETARVQAANNAAANTTPPVATAGQPTAPVDPATQNPASTSVEPTQEPTPVSTPAAEQQIAQAQPNTAVAPITTNRPAAGTQTGTSLGTFLIRNWPLALVFALVVVGLGLVFAARRTSGVAPVESLDEDSAAKLDAPRASRAKEASARALKDASAAAQASTLGTAKASTVSTAETVSTTEPLSAAETVSTAEASGADVQTLAGAAALVGGAAVAKSKKKSKKEARQEAKRKKKDVRADEPAESTVVAPVAEETAVEETVVEAPAVEEAAQEEPAEVAQAVTTEEVAEVVTEPEVAEQSFETAAPVFDTAEVETTEIAPFESETAEPFVVEAEAPAPVTEIEPAFAPEPERVQEETHSLLEGEEYDRAVVGSRDAMARQMIAAELLSALAGRNLLRRERAGTAFVEHGYYDETARDLREADAPAERSAAARSLAILGDRNATPLLVAALEDPVSDVRRAAVEALGALRDPSAVEPLEALLEREKSERNRIPPRVIRTAVEFCREGFAQTPAAETQTAIPAVEAGDLAPAFETEPAPTEEAARIVDALPAEEAAVETAPEPFADLAATDAAEKTTVSIAPFVDEAAEAEPIVAPEPAAEATGEPAHVPEPVHFEDEREAFEESATVEEELTFAESRGLETAVSEPEAVAETGVEPFVERERPFVDFEEEAAEAPEEFAAPAAEEVGIEPVAEQEEEVSTATTFDLVTEERESTQAALFDAGDDEATREIEPVAADSSKGLAPVAGEWFDFDIGEMGGESQPAASATTTPEPAAAEPVLEFSSGETFTPPAGAEVEEAAEETGHFVEAPAETGRDIEVADNAAAAPPFLHEPEPLRHEPAHVLHEPATETREKGLAPFDESSTVPASIQQRIASDNPRERAAAIIELSHVDTDEAFQQICAAFDDESRDVRSAAARALHELRADRADSFTRALREATPERRREIGSAISTSGLAAESISQLTGESRERTYEAFSLLFLMAKAGEVQPLLRAIEGHPNNEVRLAVVKLLALSGQKEVLPAFRRLAVRGSLPTEVRSAVMEAIYQISSSQPTPA
jgi:HEAT repeat protein